MSCVGSCASGVVKCILFLFNLIIFICAVLLLIGGVYAHLDKSGFESITTLGIFAIIVAVFIALVAFFGCCGAIQNNRCMLTTYAVILIVIFILQVALAIVAFLALKNGDKTLYDDVEDYLTGLYKNVTDLDNARIISAFQRSYECCGLKGPSDSQVILSNGSLISSCCSSDVTNCVKSSAYQDGCLDRLEAFLTVIFQAVGGVAIAFGVIELVAAGFALCARPSH